MIDKLKTDNNSIFGREILKQDWLSFLCRKQIGCPELSRSENFSHFYDI